MKESAYRSDSTYPWTEPTSDPVQPSAEEPRGASAGGPGSFPGLLWLPALSTMATLRPQRAPLSWTPRPPQASSFPSLAPVHWAPAGPLVEPANMPEASVLLSLSSPVRLSDQGPCSVVITASEEGPGVTERGSPTHCDFWCFGALGNKPEQPFLHSCLGGGL